MSTSFATNEGSNYRNINICRSFNQPISSTLVALSAQNCSEVILINKTGQSVYIYDSNNFSDSNRLLLEDLESIALRGITNSAQVSAKTESGTGTLYYRTQHFSMLPQQ
jgi:hypothetical protein